MLAVLSTIVWLFKYEVYYLRFGQVLALTWSGSHPTGDKEGESVRAATNFGNTAFLWIISRILRGHWEDISRIATHIQVWLVGRVLQWRLLLEQDGVRHFASSFYHCSIKCVPQVRLLLECRCRLCRLGGTDKIFSSFFITKLVWVDSR